MPTQSKTWQKKILSAAQRDGFRDLFWYIEATAPGRRIFPAAYPGRWIPLVPVGPEPDASRRIAGMVAHFFRLSNPPAMVFAEQLTDATALEQTGCLSYVWTEDVVIDAVCADCGSVERVGHTVAEGAPWLCAECGGNYGLWKMDGSKCRTNSSGVCKK